MNNLKISVWGKRFFKRNKPYPSVAMELLWDSSHLIVFMVIIYMILVGF